MRIIGNIEHPTLKITVFQHDGKLSAKFEVGLMEQTYKFRENDKLKNFNDLQKLIDASFIGEVLKNFQSMHKAREATMTAFLKSSDENEFPVII